ncbi:MAG: thiamine phosphate synthase [Myxococcales bacterium]|nr:thiamine phosphate synthase [Myxococcales bacterium]
MFDLYLITPERPPVAILETLRRALVDLPPGRVAVQLRAPQLASEERRELARALRELTKARGAELLISADLALARAIGADGVQLPERGPTPAQARALLGLEALIGASRHDLHGLRAAHADGADFATLSPVLAVPDKGAPLGVQGFAAIVRDAPLPVLALGGVTPEQVEPLMGAGAHGIALVRAVADADDPSSALHALLEQLTSRHNPATRLQS